MSRHLRFRGLWPCLLMPVLATATVYAQVYPVDTLVRTGPDDQRINIVFLSEGYQEGEMAKFRSDAEGALAALFNITPYWQYQGYFNAYAIEVPSNESGTDHPGTASDEPGGLATFVSDTYFKSTFDYAGIHRLLVPRQSFVDYVLAYNFPGWDIVFVIVNHDWYGGAGGSVATFSTHPSAGQIAIHEVGHSFADLADEYEYGGTPGREAPNATATTIRELIKWNSWIDALTPIPTPETSAYGSVVGLFEGAVYNATGWYRPRLNCMMRALGVPFCEVCREQTILSMYNLIDGIAPDSPAVSTFPIPGNASLAFSVSVLQPLGETNVLQWLLDGQPVAGDTDTYLVDASLLAQGDHRLEVVAYDTTHLVRTDLGGLLERTLEWTVQVEPPVPCPIVVPGDTDESGTVSSTDVIRLVNYAFKGGWPPEPCWLFGDADCSGALTSADIIILVNYVFKGGPPPCDACVLMEPGWWPCPGLP